MNKRLLFLVGVILIIFGLLAYFILKPSKPTLAMETLVLGSSYNQLVAIAGEPSYITDGTAWVEPQHKKATEQLVKGCVKEAWYESKLKLPSKYAFCYSVNDKLLHKYHWSSW